MLFAPCNDKRADVAERVREIEGVCEVELNTSPG